MERFKKNDSAHDDGLEIWKIVIYRTNVEISWNAVTSNIPTWAEM